ncbi:exported hypothetical protein [metagenome]|uniref:GP-PDE domain-containing protein n=1 Tax=metagenome TaxID=256318 RepID=A0A2P2C1L1_9ZZZZ
MVPRPVDGRSPRPHVLARGHLLVRALIAAIILAALATPAAAATIEDGFYGHRCRTYATATNENTVTALRLVAKSGVGCEIDVWSLEAGRCYVVVHDRTWTRVADPATLVGIPASVPATTCAQARQIRTKGGQPVPRLNAMLVNAARYDVPLLIELRNGMDPAILTRLQGADVAWYQAPSPTCRLGAIDALAAAGAMVGIKDKADCPMAPEQVAAHARFIADHIADITTDSVAAFAALGVEQMPMMVSRAGWVKASAAGARAFIVNHPRQAVEW